MSSVYKNSNKIKKLKLEFGGTEMSAYLSSVRKSLNLSKMFSNFDSESIYKQIACV